MKFIVINKRGGFKNVVWPFEHQGFINLSTGYMTQFLKGQPKSAPKHANQQGQIPAAQEWKESKETIQLVEQVLDILPATCSAIVASCYSQAAIISNLLTEKAPDDQVVSPESLLALSENKSIPIGEQEHKYVITPPTMIRKGLVLTSFTSLESINITDLESLLESSFQKRLDSKPFFDRLSQCLSRVSIAGDMVGSTIVTRETLGGEKYKGETMYYLDKFAVSPTSQGLGVADFLWTQLLADYPFFVWRSRTDNPVNKWYIDYTRSSLMIRYFDRADGHLNVGYWTVFWAGSNPKKDDFGFILECARAAMRVSASFARLE